MVNILARILDSERNFNESADPMITADRGFIQFLGPDFGFWFLGSSDRGSQRSPGNFTFSLLCHLVEKMTRNSNAVKRDGSVSCLLPEWTLSFFRSLVKGQIITNAWVHAGSETGFIQLCCKYK